MRLRLGLIGLSNDWRQRHVPALRLLAERFEVCGVYNSVSSLAENTAREFGAKPFAGFREMLACESIDALLFLESSWYGTVPIQAACDFGKAIYCGSEIEIAPQQAEDLKRLVERSGVAFMAEFPRRLAPATLRLKELIATKLGQPEILFCHRRLPLLQSNTHRHVLSSEVRMHRELMELVDWCSFIAGRPVRNIHASQHVSERKQEKDYMALSLDLSDPEAGGSTLAQISCGSYIPPSWHEASNFRPPAALQVCCENGLAFLDLPNSLIWFDDAGRHQESLESEKPVGEQLLTQFHRAVTSLVRKMADLEDICRGLEALHLARESASRGCNLPMHGSQADS